jgi:hypothetical protein
MPDTTKWVNQVLDKLVGKDEETGKFYCGVCHKLYKHEGTLKNHIKTTHADYVQQWVEEVSEEYDLNKIRYYHMLLFTETDREIGKIEKQINEAKAKLNQDFEYAFSWVTEQLLVNLETRQLLELVKKTIEHFDNLDEIHQELLELKEGWIKDVLNNFPRHNSTNELSNIHDRLKYEARAKFINNQFGGGHLNMIIRISKDLMELVDKVIPVTEIF